LALDRFNLATFFGNRPALFRELGLFGAEPLRFGLALGSQFFLCCLLCGYLRPVLFRDPPPFRQVLIVDSLLFGFAISLILGLDAVLFGLQGLQPFPFDAVGLGLSVPD